MRAISRFIPEVGISTVSWSAWLALRIRVSMSPTGSVIIASSPARLRHPGDDALMRELAQADAAHPELAEVGPRAAAPAAPVVAAGRVLRAPRLLDSECFLGHFPSYSAANGIPSARSSSRAPSSSVAVVVIVMFRPRTWDTSS